MELQIYAAALQSPAWYVLPRCKMSRHAKLGSGTRHTQTSTENQHIPNNKYKAMRQVWARVKHIQSETVCLTQQTGKCEVSPKLIQTRCLKTKTKLKIHTQCFIMMSSKGRRGRQIGPVPPHKCHGRQMHAGTLLEKHNRGYR